jgi:thiol:disulfide interchange protein DsbC
MNDDEVIKLMIHKIGFFLSLMMYSVFSYSDVANDQPELKKQIEEAILSSVGGNPNRFNVKYASYIEKDKIIIARLESGETLYMVSDMKYMIINGQLIKLNKNRPEDMTKKWFSPIRASLLSEVPEDELVIFKAEGEEKAEIYVFTDIDCGYCQKLHNEVPELTKAGITVKYLAFPRAGIKKRGSDEYTGSYKKLKSVWCDKNPQEALTKAKKSRRIKDNICAGIVRKNKDQTNNVTGILRPIDPVEEQLMLGQEIGVNGTPAIFFQNGESNPGYVPAKKLISMALNNK